MSDVTQDLYAFPASIAETAVREHPALAGIENPFVRSAEISSNRLDSYFTRMDPATTLRNYAQQAAAGVSILDSHNSYRLGVGYSFTGEVTTGEDGATVVLSDWYTIPGLRFGSTHSFASTDDYIKAVEAKIVRKISVGFYGGRHVCDICKQNYYSWDCPHIGGIEYEIEDETGRHRVTATATIFDANLAEYSLVYMNATPGASLRKMEREVKEGRLTPENIQLLESRYRMTLPARQLIVPGVDLLDKDGHSLARTTTGDQPMNLEQELNEARAALTEANVNESVPVAGGIRQLHQTAVDLQAQLDAVRIALPEAAEGSDMASRVAWLAAELNRLRTLADDGRAYRTDLIDAALAEGVRAMGPEFAQEAYRGLLTASTIEVIKRMRDDWRAIGDKAFPGDRQTIDEDENTSTPAKKNGRSVELPAAAHKA